MIDHPDHDPCVEELEANLDYLKKRGLAIATLLQNMQAFEDAGMSEFGINEDAYFFLKGNLSDVLLDNETERAVCKRDLEKARYEQVSKYLI